MKGFKERGEVKEVTLALKAIGYFHKTVQGFLEATKRFTGEQQKRYCKLLVAEYRQFHEIADGADGL